MLRKAWRPPILGGAHQVDVDLFCQPLAHIAAAALTLGRDVQPPSSLAALAIEPGKDSCLGHIHHRRRP